jgi:electron transfer flavoprotein alpha subunit
MSVPPAIWVLVEEGAKGDIDNCSAMLLRHATRLAGQLSPSHQVVALCASAPTEDHLRFLERLRRSGAHSALVLESEAGADGGFNVATMCKLIGEQLPRIVLIPGTPAPGEVAARTAASLQLPLVSDCVGIEVNESGDLVFDVSTAGGMALVSLNTRAPATLVVMPLREMAQEDEAPSERAMLVARTPNLPSPSLAGVEQVSAVPISPQDMTLAEAPVIVSGGRGIGGPEAFDMLRELAGHIGAHVGASRVATDLGWIDRDHLVGMSGSTVRPSLYFAIGISGAPHHLMGMREATSIIALNNDPSAPIFQLATHAFIGDAGEVVPKVIQRLAEMRAST